MKRVLLVTALVLSSVPAMAQHHGYGYGYHRHYHGGYGGGWIAPLIIGGAVGYAITRAPDPVIVQQPPVIVQQPPVVVGAPLPANNPNCGPWTETQQPDGSIVRQRTCTQ